MLLYDKQDDNEDDDDVDDDDGKNDDDDDAFSDEYEDSGDAVDIETDDKA